VLPRDFAADFDPAAHRILLLGHKHQFHAAFADLFHELVGADDCARAFADWLLIDRGR
jgi:hypothetical protein